MGMTDNHTLIAFLATLGAIVVLVGIAVFAASDGRSFEALGIGGAVTGLIGVLGTFRPRTNSGDATGKADDPVNVTETGT
jgi:hypothetical protein